MEKEFLIFDVISDTGKYILLLNTILYFKSYRNKSIAFKIFAFYLLFISIIQVITGYMRDQKEDNLFLSHYYFIGQFLFLSFFYLNLEVSDVRKNVIKTLIACVLIILGFYYYLNPDDFSKFNPFETIITSLPLIVYSFLFFMRKIDSADKKFIYLNSGVFLYLSCSTLLFGAGNIKAAIKNLIWYSNLILYLLYLILIFIEWYKNFRKPSIKN